MIASLCHYYLTCRCDVFLCAGPWFIGQIIDGHVGVLAAWGIYIRGAFIPGTLTYVYALMQVGVMPNINNIAGVAQEMNLREHTRHCQCVVYESFVTLVQKGGGIPNYSPT